MSLMRTIQRLALRRFGTGMFVIGGAGVLEWLQVFGDGGSLVQLIVSSIAVAVGIWIMTKASPRRYESDRDTRSGVEG